MTWGIVRDSKIYGYLLNTGTFIKPRYLIDKVKRFSMWEQTKKSPQVKTLILIVIVASFVPFSYLWYDQLTNFKCAGANTSTNIHETSLNGNQNCTQKTDMHWVLFYGINSMMYGVPLMTVVLKSKRK